MHHFNKILIFGEFTTKTAKPKTELDFEISRIKKHPNLK
jgi:hypothetical protein